MSEGFVVLCVNCGSSSLKFGLYAFGSQETPLVAGGVEGVGMRAGRLWT